MIAALVTFISRYALVGSLILAGVGWAGAGVQTLRLAWLQSSTARAAVQASEDARNKERIANAENGKVVDELLKDRAIAVAAAASSAERLRVLSATRSAAAAACASNNETAAANLPDRTRIDLESQADRADEVANQLAAAQAYIRTVCRPE